MSLDILNELNTFKNNELKNICSNNNIKKTGNKQQLINRIMYTIDRKIIFTEIKNTKNKFNEIKLENYIKNDIKTYPKNNLIEISKKLNINCKNINKNEIVENINIFFKKKYEFPIIFIQNYYKFYIYKKIIKLKGPALYNRDLCNNKTDFFNLSNIKDIPNKYFFSFRDQDNFIYGFEINSIFKMIQYEKINPYNRNKLSDKTINNIKYIYKLINISCNLENLSLNKSIEQYTIDIFQTIDNLGNYTNISWFLNLNLNSLKKFYRELEDIWQYRLSLSTEQKKQIIYPTGILFKIPISTIFHMTNKKQLQIICIKIMEKLISKGINEDCKKQGCYYILMALTIVSTEAANALPWLANSVIT